MIALAAAPASAYVGPGAGFALVSSFLVIFVTLILALVSLLIWPVRTLWRLLRRKQRAKPSIRRLIVVGLDGQDPRLTDRFMSEGKLPNFKRLAEMGSYERLQTTFPSVSPVAWSSFATGANPAKHNIFDFLDRDLRTYLPTLSSTHIGSVDRFLRLGKYRLPLGKPELRLHGIWSTVLRVPITFTPDRFYGAQLAAMCVPDLLGTQGTFLLFTTRPAGEKFKEGGMRVPLSGNSSDRYEATIEGPENLFLEDSPAMTLPLVIDLNGDGDRANVALGGEKVDLERGKLTDWVTLSFRAAPGVKVNGICRLLLLETGEHVSLYMTPISLDPENPAMPISHPNYYSTYLAKLIGPYSALGLAEDTWALNEGVIDDEAFLQLTHDIDHEREKMFFAAMDRLRLGSLVCVFDATDRIQHMFWRYLDPDHPAGGDRDQAEHRDAIEKLYERNDALVGKVMDRLRDGDLLMVLSDHGFTSFRRGINLNSWLLANGYLKLKPGADGAAEWLRDVDWSATRAYAVGLTGMFLNIEGREAEGIVGPGEEAAALKAELIERLNGLADEEKGEIGITEVFDTAEIYRGPYKGNAPDLLIGYNSGYRTSWDCATGVVAGPVFEDNLKAWSGDHCVDPRQVPGVFFCNREIDTEEPALIDVAPTALQLFGLPPAPHMEGRALFAAAGTEQSDGGGGA
jgi:predicted AlkP superfamily phosphohydrolase/phosphomutase